MGKGQRQNRGQRKRSGSGWLTWVIVAAVVGAAGYGISQMSNVAFDEDDIKVVNFQGLTASQKQTALEDANAARCSCGCWKRTSTCTCPQQSTLFLRVD